MPAAGVRIIQYKGEVGVVLQHLGILVGYQARGPKVMNTPILEVNCH
jgi:hypothetical protein